ncbi:MAG: hypothetical protein K6U75_10270 [Firmicutes bacterium]|nr:hypothetical protein [Bacillota bacterium]
MKPRTARWARSGVVWMCFVFVIMEASAQPPLSPSSEAGEPIRFTQILEKLAQKTRLGLLAECYYAEELIPPTNAAMLGEDWRLETVAAVYRREVVRTRNVIILRPATDIAAVRRLEETQSSVRFPAVWWKGYDLLEMRSWKNADGGIQMSVKASGVPLSRFCEQFQKETGWRLQVEAELHTVRIFASWESASPGEVVEAIALLLRGGVEVSISRTAEQKAAEQKLEARQKTTEQWSVKQKYTDELLDGLLQELSAEELSLFQQGAEVEIPLSRLSPELHARALRFISDSLEELISQLALDAQMPLMRLREQLAECQPTIKLPTPMRRWLGVKLTDPATGESHVF